MPKVSIGSNAKGLCGSSEWTAALIRFEVMKT